MNTWDIVYIQLYSSDLYNESTYAILLANWISATYSVITESREPQQSSTISFLDELRKLLEQLQNKDTDTNTKPTNTNTTIDTSRRSAPHTAPNKKVYNLYKTVDGKYSSHNFQIKKYFTSLAEMKSYINKNNPK